MNNIFTAS